MASWRHREHPQTAPDVVVWPKQIGHVLSMWVFCSSKHKLRPWDNSNTSDCNSTMRPFVKQRPKHHENTNLKLTFQVCMKFGETIQVVSALSFPKTQTSQKHQLKTDVCIKYGEAPSSYVCPFFSFCYLRILGMQLSRIDSYS